MLPRPWFCVATALSCRLLPTGGTGNIQLSFSGLAGATKYFGSVAYSGSTGLLNPAIVRMNTL